MSVTAKLSVILTFVVGVSLTLALAWFVHVRETERIRERLAGDVGVAVASLQRELDISFELLDSFRRLFEVSPQLTREQFHQVASDSLRDHPEIRAIEWLPRVAAADRVRFEEAARDDGFSHFEFTERRRQGEMMRAGPRDEHFPVYYVEPFVGNEAALGFDLASDETRRISLLSSRDAGTLRLSARVTLVQETATERGGILVFAPVFDGPRRTIAERRAGLRGFVLGAYSVDDIVDKAMSIAGPAGDVEFHLVDETAPDDQRRLYGTGHGAATPDSAAAVIEVPGRTWRLHGVAGEGYFVARRGWHAYSLLITGLSLSLIGAAVVGYGLSRTGAVRRLVEARTRDVAHQKDILQAVLDNLGDGVAVADENGRLVLFNPAAEKILGLGVTDSGPEDWATVYGLFRPDTVTPVTTDEMPLAQAVKGNESRDVELFVRNPKLRGGVFIRVTATPLKERAGEAIRGGVAVFRDITDRKWTEAVLRDSEARFRSIVEATGSALIILSPDRRVLEFNPKAEQIYGRSRGEVLGESYFELFLPEEYRDPVAEDIKNALAGRPTLDFEIPVTSVEGGTRVMLWSVSRLTGVDGQPTGVIATGHDITERKGAEEAQRVRQLAAHLQSARESERKYIAREIHDELGQALTGLKFEFSHVSRQLGEKDVELKDRLAGLQKLIDSTIGSVRRIAAELRPQILDKLGLIEAIRWQAHEFHERTGIGCSLDLPDDEIDWGPERATAIFRIFQESLTNVARHSGARRVAVRMSTANGQVVLDVSDDGRGITDDEMANTQSFGLLGMQERARMFGGSLKVTGAPDSGTTVRVKMPF